MIKKVGLDFDLTEEKMNIDAKLSSNEKIQESIESLKIRSNAWTKQKEEEKDERRIYNYTGECWDEKYLSPHKSKRSVFTASSEQVRNPINNKSLGGWEKYRDLLEPAFPYISKNKDLKRYLDN